MVKIALRVQWPDRPGRRSLHWNEESGERTAPGFDAGSATSIGTQESAGIPAIHLGINLREWHWHFARRLRDDASLCYTTCMADFAAPVERLIDELKHLPGIGQKTAQRLAFHILRASPEEALGLAEAIRDAKEKIRTCSTCHNITDTDPCLYCSGANRNKRTICVVEEAHNIMAVEKTRTYDGMYHVMGGSLSPLQGRGPDQLNIKSLIERLKGGTVEEIIIATNPTAEGEATAVYLSKLLKPLGVRVTRIGVGIPVGADLEYADEVTMLKAMEGRREM
jgi:recombination protein RecR